MRQVEGHVSRECQWGSDGACLERASGSCVDPISYYSGDFNLYRYCGDNSVIYVDPSGLAEWPALPPYDPDKDTGGMSYSDWVNQFWNNISLPASQATQALKDAFLATAKKGCIGVAAVAAGYSDINEFMKQLNEGYWTEKKAWEVAQKKNVEGARDVYGKKPCATLVAIQFGKYHWDQNLRKPVEWNKANFGEEPVDLTKPANWDAVNIGVGWDAVRQRAYPSPGSFDVQVWSPRLDIWLGGSRGETLGQVHDTTVFSLTEAEFWKHIERGDTKNYGMHLWFVVPEKAYNEK
jgi:hypothetical protein